jgi:hypothetical protein
VVVMVVVVVVEDLQELASLKFFCMELLGYKIKISCCFQCYEFELMSEF